MIGRLAGSSAGWFVAAAYLFPVTTRAQVAGAPSAAADRKAEYVHAVTRGAGFLPWQDEGLSDREREFRRSIEERKDAMLAGRTAVTHPVLLTDDQIKRARRHIDLAEWARDWYQQHSELADYLIEQPDDYVLRMVPELTPTHPYGFTCPACVGEKSQEAVGRSLVDWDYRKPEVCSCARCGQVYPSAHYPESAVLICPRSEQTFTYYLNEQERANPDDRSGRHAYHWVGRPIHVSFTGVIRQLKAQFMINAARSLALSYRFTQEPRYARRAIEILVRLAHCYRNWLYHDYWDTIADCDPMYAAWHDKNLPLEWKRHLCADAYQGDGPGRAAMLQTYWGAGRLHPSCDSIGHLATIALAYDLVHDARDADDRPLWTSADRAKVERDLLLEYALGAEPYVGTPGKGMNTTNKAPRVYRPQAVVAKCLGLTELAHSALSGYEAVRDESFLFDGFSRESPSYNNMFLAELVLIPEELHGFRWPEGFRERQGAVDYYRTDDRLGLMYRAMIDQLRPDGRYPPLADTNVPSGPSLHLIELGIERYPEFFDGKLPALRRGRPPTEYALFNLEADQLTRDRGLDLPEICYPVWRTAIMRHGQGPEAAMLTLTFSPDGIHRHNDNLALFYTDGGHTLLGDLGYVGDMPLNSWIRSTRSHNLVIVDGAEQRYAGRQPQLHRFVTSPVVSVAEASSQVYEQCREYRRLVALIKGPGGQTLAVDIFRVRGGKHHDYRLFSELASSEVTEGALEFDGLAMPDEPPLPQIKGSLKREDIFGLRDARGVDDPPAAWRATWKERDRSYRVWVLSPADRVEASNGPGQETRDQAGRRVRYLDAIREGEDLESTFVVLHEPSGRDQMMPILRAERLDVPAEAGPDAVGVRIESSWGTYVVLSGFAQAAEVEGIRFNGAFGILKRNTQGTQWLMASEAATLTTNGFGFSDVTPAWSGEILNRTKTSFTTSTPRPADWQATPDDVTTYVLVGDSKQSVGLPVRDITENAIQIERFPMPPAQRFHLGNVRLLRR